MAGYEKPFVMGDVNRMLEFMHDQVDEYMDRAWASLTGGPVARPVTTEHKAEETVGPSFSDNIDMFFKEKQRKVSDHRPYSHQTVLQHRASFRLWVALNGEKPTTSYQRRDAGNFRDTLLRIPSSFGKGGETDPLLAIAKADGIDDAIRQARKVAPTSKDAKKEPVKRMQMKTVKRHFSALSQYWQHLSTQGLIGDAANIFLGWPFPGTKTRVAKRDLWTPEHLRNLFTSDYWNNAKVTSAIHWLPLIALHSGLRVDEIANIRVPEDIGDENGVMFFNIQEHGTEVEVLDEVTGKWTTKTVAGIRRVPVHSWLIGHGMRTLVDFRRKQRAGLLFPELKPSGPDGKLSASCSRVFWQKIALNIPERIVFHCFRTTFRHTIAQSRFSDAQLDAVTGHEGPKVPSRHVDALHGNAGEDRGVGAVYERPNEFALHVLRDVVEFVRPPLDLSFIAPVKPTIDAKRAPA